MKSLILKLSLFLCLTAVANLSAQSTTTTVKTTTVKKAPAKKAPAKKPVKKTSTTTTKVKTNTDVITVGTPKQDAPPPPVNVTGGMPVMTFDKKTIDFGKIKTGERPEVTYNFTNTGNAPLDIDIVSGCDCTELDWTRSTVQPGAKGFVKATFKSDKAEAEDHKKPLKKYVTIVLKQVHTQSGYALNSEVTFDVFIVD
jgi:Protein of unknown function (DUF1573)